MSLIELTVNDVRCLRHVELALHPRLNLIWGSNGSGKTSLLEAIFLLGRGRSFRTRNSERLIRHGQQRLVVFGRTGGAVAAGLSRDALVGAVAAGTAGVGGYGVPHALGVQVSRADGTIARI